MLHRDVQRIRSAAAGHDAGAAHAAVVTLRADVASLVSRGRLAAADARVLTVEAGQADGRVSVEVKPASAPATQPATVAPAPVTVVQGNGNGDANGNSNGNGHGPGNGNGNGDGHGHGHGGGDGGD